MLFKSQGECRGAKPLCTPLLRGGLTPSSALHPWGGRSARSWLCHDRRPGSLCGAGSPCTHYAGAPPRTPGDFRFTTKVTKGVSGGNPPEPPEGDASLPLRFPHPLDRVSDTKIDRFATLSGWANRSFFSPSYTGGHTFSSQSVARQLGFVSANCPEFLPFLGGAALVAAGGMIIAPQGEYPEGLSPLGDSLVTFSSGRKSPGVEGRSALLMGECRGGCAPSHRGLQGPRPCDYSPYSSQSWSKVQNAFSAVLRWAVAGVMMSCSPLQHRSTVMSSSCRRMTSITLAGMLM